MGYKLRRKKNIYFSNLPALKICAGIKLMLDLTLKLPDI